MPRKYDLKRRAERQDETRIRIVDATVALHKEIGPARTTIKAIAERAGVERLTVYRHFPDEGLLFGACGARFREKHPPPDPGVWVAEIDPVARVRLALTGLYAWYADNESMIANAERDAELLPALRAARAPFAQYQEAVAAILARGWGRDDDAMMRLAAARLAIDFHSWRSLVQRQALPVQAAIELMVTLIASAGIDRTR